MAEFLFTAVYVNVLLIGCVAELMPSWQCDEDKNLAPNQWSYSVKQ